MFDVDQDVRSAEINLGLFISVRAMELKMQLKQEFADLRDKRNAALDELAFHEHN